MSPPPLSSGGFHESEIVSAVVSVYVNGPFGTPGLSTTITSISAESLPYSFVAVTVYVPASCLVDSSIRKIVFSSLKSVETLRFYLKKNFFCQFNVINCFRLNI